MFTSLKKHDNCWLSSKGHEGKTTILPWAFTKVNGVMSEPMAISNKKSKKTSNNQTFPFLFLSNSKVSYPVIN
jgi:hypothetical protein